MKNEFAGGTEKKKQKEKGRSLLQCNTLNRAFCSCWAILKWLLNLVRLCICTVGGNGAISRALRQRVRRWQCHTSLGQPELGRLLSEYELYTRAIYIYTHTHTHTRNINIHTYILTPTTSSSSLLHITLLNPLLTTAFPVHLKFQLPSQDFLHELCSPGSLLAFVNATLFIWNVLSTSTSH